MTTVQDTSFSTDGPDPDAARSAAPASYVSWLAPAAGGVTLVLWASAFVAIRHLGQEVGPGALSLGRLVIAAAVLALLLVLPRRSRRGRAPAPRWVAPTGREWALLAAAGIGWFGIYNLALNEAERRIDAGTAALLIQVGPIIVAMLATVLLGERLHRWLVLGTVVGFAGVVVIAQGFSASGGGDLVGVGLTVLAACMYAVGVLSQKPLLRRLPALQVTMLSVTIGAVCCLPWTGDLIDLLQHGSASTIGWIIYLGVLPTAIAFTTWAYALTHTDAGKLALTTFLVPFITTLIAWLTLSEVPPLLTFVGGGLAIAGVLLTRRRPR